MSNYLPTPKFRKQFSRSWK